MLVASHSGVLVLLEELLGALGEGADEAAVASLVHQEVLVTAGRLLGVERELLASRGGRVEAVEVPVMPSCGVLSRRKLTASEEDDIRFGFVTAKAMGGMDIGQTVVVKHKAVMAVEAIEGTDACIRRGGALGREKSVVVKVAKPNQDPRFDVPAVGKQTILSMIESHCNVLAMEAGRTLFVEQDEVLDLANRHDICICAVDKNF